MIEFRNVYSTVKLVLDCAVKHYQDIPENIMRLIDAICNSNNYCWRVTQHKYINVPVIPASLLAMEMEMEVEEEQLQESLLQEELLQEELLQELYNQNYDFDYGDVKY